MYRTQNVSVIICSYTEQRWTDLVEAIESVKQQTRPVLEVVVAIDHNPVLLERLRTRFPEIVAVENHYEKGASGSRNCGAAVARGEILAFLDDDAVAEPDWVEKLCQGYTHDRIIGVGGKITPLWSEKRPAWFPEEFNWVIGATYRGMPEKTSPSQKSL